MSEAVAPGPQREPHPSRPRPGGSAAERIAVGEVVLDRAAHLVTVAGRPVALAMLEFRLLDLLMSRADHVVPTAEILDRVWGASFTGDPGTVAVHVLRLRRKLALDGASGHVRTVRGIGYVFDTQPVIG